MAQTRTITRLGQGGRVVIPAGLRKQLGIETGDPVLIILESDSLTITTPRRAVKRVQNLVRRHVGPDRRLSRELIEERRRESLPSPQAAGLSGSETVTM